MKKLLVAIVATVTLAFGGVGLQQQQVSASTGGDAVTACHVLNGQVVLNGTIVRCVRPNNSLQNVCVFVLYVRTGYSKYAAFVCSIMGYGGTVYVH
jgi:hypothetical protein